MNDLYGSKAFAYFDLYLVYVIWTEGRMSKIGVECQIFVIVIFFDCSQVLQFGADSRYFKCALTQKRSFLALIILYLFCKYVQI